MIDSDLDQKKPLEEKTSTVSLNVHRFMVYSEMRTV